MSEGWGSRAGSRRWNCGIASGAASRWCRREKYLCWQKKRDSNDGEGSPMASARSAAMRQAGKSSMPTTARYVLRRPSIARMVSCRNRNPLKPGSWVSSSVPQNSRSCVLRISGREKCARSRGVGQTTRMRSLVSVMRRPGMPRPRSLRARDQLRQGRLRLVAQGQPVEVVAVVFVLWMGRHPHDLCLSSKGHLPDLHEDGEVAGDGELFGEPDLCAPAAYIPDLAGHVPRQRFGGPDVRGS